MAFDPTLPVDDSLIIALELRNQFNGLKALIDAQAAGLTALQALVAQQAGQIVALQATVADHTTDLAGHNQEILTQGALVGNHTSQLSQHAVDIAALQQDVGQQSAGLLNLQGTVSNLEVNSARNPTSVGPLNVQLSNPLTDADGSQIVNKVNELLNALSHP